MLSLNLIALCNDRPLFFVHLEKRSLSAFLSHDCQKIRICPKKTIAFKWMAIPLFINVLRRRKATWNAILHRNLPIQYWLSTLLFSACVILLSYYCDVPCEQRRKISNIVRTMETHCMLSTRRFCHQGHAGFEAEVCRFCVRKLLKD